MPSCSLPGCKAPEAIKLHAQPPPGPEAERTFGFCAIHAPIYRDLGYKPAPGSQGQLVALYDE